MFDRPTQPAGSLSGRAKDSSENELPETLVGISNLTQQPEFQIPIAGIVASAGGLTAFNQFFEAMPADSGVAFVLVPHLDATHESLMVELIARHTKMPVVEATDAMAVEVNCVYIIPPNHSLAINKGALRLSNLPEPATSQTAIDFFLRSLATDQGSRAIGIVLSGTGSHGTLGIREIKQCGGMAMAQSPESAEFDQMPRSAIETGLVDFVLSPDQMPQTLIKHVRQPYVNLSPAEVTQSEETQSELAAIIKLIHRLTKFDFSHYRSGMLLRRIERRMGLLQIADIQQYREQLPDLTNEPQALVKDFLIGVTAFFRDSDDYAQLEHEVIPGLIAKHSSEVPIRIWVASCATGEEAYSISMLMFEAFITAEKPANFQIFASDINSDSIDFARRGLYPSSIATDVNANRLNRFFVTADDLHYRVSKPLRDSIVFSKQNLLRDAPFSRMDLVSCRNVLIYLEPEVQQQLISLFHFALNQDGYLILGPSETVGRGMRLFDSVSKKCRIYRRVGLSDNVTPAIRPAKNSFVQSSMRQLSPAFGPKRSYREIAEKYILRDYAPATALINQHHKILNVTGPLANFLEFPTGELTKNLLAMARPGLRTKLRLACRKASQEQTEVTDVTARVNRNGTYWNCKITVRPILGQRDKEGLMLILFHAQTPNTVHDTSKPTTNQDLGNRTLESDAAMVDLLEYELKTAHDELQNSIERMSLFNEELQSSNEELESSKQELQSLNEELNTVNCELLEKVAELDQSNSEITNLMISTEIATLFLDKQLHVKRFTTPAIELFQPTSLVINRILQNIESPLVDPQLVADCQRVLVDAKKFESEVTTVDGRCFLRRTLPFRAVDNVTDGIVITYHDVTQRKRNEAKIHETNMRLSAILSTASDAIIMIDERGIIDSANQAAQTIFGYSKAELVGQNVSMLMPPPFRDEHDGYIQRYLDTGEARIIGVGREVLCRRKDGSTFPADLSVSQVDHLGFFMGVLRDISSRKAMQKHALEIAADEQRRIGLELHDGTQQELTGLTLFANVLLETIEQGPYQVHSDFDSEPTWQFKDVDYQRLRKTTSLMAKRLSEANGHVRDLAHGIMPVQIDAEGLRSALSELATDTTTDQVRCRVNVSKNFALLQNTTATHLYRIAQEAVSNALRHGKASRIGITLAQHKDSLMLEIADNGNGFNPADVNGINTPASGLGLRTMEYRANLIGGSIRITENPEGGTLVRCLVLHEVFDND